MLNSEIANYIKSNTDIAKCMVIADSAEPKSIAEIKAHGVSIKGVKKGKGSILSGISGMQECNYLLTKNSTELIKEFDRYSWDKDKNGAVTNKPIDIYNHGIDAVRYLTSELISKRTGYKQAF
jgi:phage terminase large subunit